MMPPRLHTDNLCLAFGGLVVSSNVTLNLEHGARTALIGPNGAGKTTIVNLISGVLAPTSGQILLDGKSVTGLSQAARVRGGIVRTFQVNRLFKDLSVGDNLRAGILQRRGVSMRVWQSKSERAEVDQEIYQQLTVLGIAASFNRIVGAMSLGEQRLVEIALALVLQPRVLLLDEPAAGVPQSESGIILEAIGNLPEDLAVLLIEHDMDMVFRFARKIIVLAAGVVLAEGTPEEIAGNDQVKQVYFGRGGHGAH